MRLMKSQHDPRWFHDDKAMLDVLLTINATDAEYRLIVWHKGTQERLQTLTVQKPSIKREA